MMLGAWTLNGQQQSGALSNFKYQYKVGVLPFVDNTGSGGSDTGTALGRAVQAEIAHSTDLMGRVLNLDENTKPEDVDGEKAVAIARERKVDVVLVGTVLEANTEESDKSASGPSIFGQSLGGSARAMKAIVSLQGDLYNVTTGRLIESIRVTGNASDTKVGANVNSSLGGIATGGASFTNSTIGKALHKAVADLVKKLSADEPKMTRYKPAAGEKPSEETPKTDQPAEQPQN
jgi:hypothetical protein